VTSRGARRQEQRELARSLRAQGRSWSEVAAALRDRYALTARVAMRVAHEWSQADAAGAWNARWPDDPKSFKNISYWETWPSPTGHAPSLAVLDRLAQVYECSVADLVAGWGEHGSASGAAPTEPETLAWQVGHLDLPELTRSMADWAERLPEAQRRALLLKLSTASAVAAAAGAPERLPAFGAPAGARALVGTWTSTYRYSSTGRDAVFDGQHTVLLEIVGGRLVGRSRPQPSGSELELDLAVEGNLVTGSWTERTSPHGHYRAAVYRGLLHLVVDPTGRAMTGRWLGVGKRYEVKSGEWRLDWLGHSAGPVTTATTVEPETISPASTSENSPRSSLPT
jgi:hypothetical protein